MLVGRILGTREIAALMRSGRLHKALNRVKRSLLGRGELKKRLTGVASVWARLNIGSIIIAKLVACFVAEPASEQPELV